MALRNLESLLFFFLWEEEQEDSSLSTATAPKDLNVSLATAWWVFSPLYGSCSPSFVKVYPVTLSIINITYGAKGNAFLAS